MTEVIRVEVEDRPEIKAQENDRSASRDRPIYRMPAEWEPHESTWISWPHNEETWPHELPAVEATMARAVAALSTGETVRININCGTHERRARAALDEAGVRGQVVFHRIPTNDAWVRDYGPLFVRCRGGLVATCWGFNSWGGKYPPFDLDDAAAGYMAKAIGVPAVKGEMILEGGSIDVNGEGLLLTTSSCLLESNRNPSLERRAIETRLREYLGISQIIWLRKGIAGDDTDGHIDDLTRFVGRRRVLTVVEHDPSRPNYEQLQENLEVLRSVRVRKNPEYGLEAADLRTPEEASDDAGEAEARLEIVELPMPDPVYVKEEIMPASYANFYVGNAVVLAPTFDDPQDPRALKTLQQVFPDREVVGIYCGDLIWGLGAFHCLTQQVPLVQPKSR